LPAFLAQGPHPVGQAGKAHIQISGRFEKMVSGQSGKRFRPGNKKPAPVKARAEQ
jgi:hypothetical protein